MSDGVICYKHGATITIGAKTIISQRTHLCAGTHDYEHPNLQLCAYPIDIEANVWVCTEAFIGPGVRIGEGSVVGARSVVTKDVSPWIVCGGESLPPHQKEAN